MPLDPVALEAARRVWGDGPPLSVSALEAIRPIWLPAYRAACTEPGPVEELPDAA
ncbi:hypothetical protein KGD82_16830 [Nocardiopsis eucommiae]|uniref:Uncharacterized protein n=1 Tax=Nocardiopsis eucommiae TaxID=2831970 RepID=A0A975QJH9_9ACTN|nr:hypothetical protein KGD82_16830 [Nocardiopsis eucommiae]